MLVEAVSSYPAGLDFVGDGLSPDEKNILDWADGRLFTNPNFLASKYGPDNWPSDVKLASVLVQMILRLALIDILLALAPIALGLWILPHTAGWGRHWLRLFMTTVFQQAVQLIALALGFGFLHEFAGIAAFEPVQDLIWKLLMSVAFIYMATKVPSMLGNHGTPASYDLNEIEAKREP